MQERVVPLESRASAIDHPTFELVAQVLVAIEGVRSERIAPEAHLLDDVGLDSFQFVDLTVALERALGVERFPMQEWVDDTKATGGTLTVGALADVCQALQRAKS
jgi:acyl carrier protein